MRPSPSNRHPRPSPARFMRRAQRSNIECPRSRETSWLRHDCSSATSRRPYRMALCAAFSNTVRWFDRHAKATAPRAFRTMSGCYVLRYCSRIAHNRASLLARECLDVARAGRMKFVSRTGSHAIRDEKKEAVSTPAERGALSMPGRWTPRASARIGCRDVRSGMTQSRATIPY